MFITAILTIAGIALLTYAVRQYRALTRSLANGREIPQLEKYPSVSVIRPIKGLDCEARENIRAALEMSYPGEFETIFVLDDQQEPAFPVLKEEIKAAVSRNENLDVRVLFCGEPPPGCTGKLNAMIEAYKLAKGEVISFIDSDLRPKEGSLQKLVDALFSDSKIGSTFGQVIVSSKPRTIGDVGYALLLNGFYTPAVYFSAVQNNFRFPFIMGQMMVLKREAIETMGGLEKVKGQLVDDMYIGQLFHQHGYQNFLAPVHLPIVHHSLDIKGFWKLYIRWVSFSRAGLPGASFKMISWLRGMVFWGGILLALGAGIAGYSLSALLGLATAVFVAWSLNKHHLLVSKIPLSWRQKWIGFALIVVSPLVYLDIFADRKVTWRGRNYQLDLKGQLATKTSETLSDKVVPIAERRKCWSYISPEKDRRKAVAA